MTSRWILLALTLAGCAGTEVGNPPFSPETPDPGYEIDDAEIIPDTADDQDVIELRVAADSLPEGASMTVVNLDRGQTVIELSGEGALVASLTALPGDVLRVQLTTESRRKSPVDYRVVSLNEIVAHERELEECVRFEARDIEATDSSIEVRIRNDCEIPLSFAAPFLLREDPGFVIEDGAFELAPDAIGEVHVAVERAPTADDYLVLSLTSPVTERFVITVRASD